MIGDNPAGGNTHGARWGAVTACGNKGKVSGSLAHGSGVGQDCQASLGQGQALSLPREQGQTKRRLHFGNMASQGWLRQAQISRTSAE